MSKTSVRRSRPWALNDLRPGNCLTVLLTVPTLALTGCFSNQEQMGDAFDAISLAADAETKFGSVFKTSDTDGNTTDGTIRIGYFPADGSPIDLDLVNDPDFPNNLPGLALYAELRLPMRAGMTEEPEPIGLLASMDSLRPARALASDETNLDMPTEGILQEHWLDGSDDEETYRAYVNVVEHVPDDPFGASDDWYVFGSWFYANGDWETEVWESSDLDYGFTGVFVEGPEFGLPDPTDPDRMGESYTLADLEGDAIYQGDVRGMFARQHPYELWESFNHVDVGPFWASSMLEINFTEQVIKGCVSCRHDAQGIIGSRLKTGEFVDADLSSPTALPFRLDLLETPFNPNDGTFFDGGTSIYWNGDPELEVTGGSWGGSMSIVNTDFTSERGDVADLPRRIATTGGARWQEETGVNGSLIFSSVAVPYDYTPVIPPVDPIPVDPNTPEEPGHSEGSDTPMASE